MFYSLELWIFSKVAICFLTAVLLVRWLDGSAVEITTKIPPTLVLSPFYSNLTTSLIKRWSLSSPAHDSGLASWFVLATETNSNRQTKGQRLCLCIGACHLSLRLPCEESWTIGGWAKKGTPSWALLPPQDHQAANCWGYRNEVLYCPALLADYIDQPCCPRPEAHRSQLSRIIRNKTIVVWSLF